MTGSKRTSIRRGSRLSSRSPPLAGKFLRSREREKVPGGRLRVMGMSTNSSPTIYT